MSTRPIRVIGHRRRGKNRRTTRDTSHTHGASRQASGALAHNAKRAATLLLGVAALAGAAFGTHWGLRAFKQSQRLRVNSIAITGNHRALASELLGYTGISRGDSILDVDLDAAARQLLRHPWVETASVRRMLPDRIAISVREHVPVILVALGDVYMASAEGVLFKRLSADDQATFPVLTGMSRDEAAKEPQRTEERIRAAVALLVAARSHTAAFGRIEEIHWDRDLGWSLVTAKSDAPGATVRIHLGKAPKERLQIAERTLSALAELGKAPQVIWADGTKNPYRIHARLRQLSASTQELTLIAKAK